MSYAVKDLFLTLQGEGLNAGRCALFVRFSGCNAWTGREQDRDKGAMACSKWCDTDFFKGQKYEADELVAAMNAAWQRDKVDRFCVLTGGEPMLQLDDTLLHLLARDLWSIAVETNGSVRNEAAVSYASHICVSPKIGGTVLSDYFSEASELKVVLPGSVDETEGWKEHELLRFEEQLACCDLYVQPQDPLLSGGVEDTFLHPRSIIDLPHKASAEAYEKHVQQCINWVMDHPTWKLGAQLHKLWRLK